MTSNPLIKFISIGLYAGILLHAIQGILISWMSKNMGLLGTLILFFLCVHMGDFWFKMKFTDQLPMVSYGGGEEIKDLYTQVYTSFSKIWIVIIYLIGLVALALHLLHGFQSAFTTLGIRHKKYTPLIKLMGIGFSITIPLLYAVIPLWVLVKNAANY